MHKTLKRWFPVFTLPTFLAFTAVFLIPLVMGLYLSFCEFRTVSDAVFVGFKNYIRAFSEDNKFISSLLFTVKFAIVSVITVNVFAFILALLLTRGIKGTNLFRTVFFMPNLIGGIVLGYIWQLIINGVLYRYGYSVTSNADYGFLGLVIMMNWQMIGYLMVIYIAGLQSVSGDILEAAEVDGAGKLRTVFRIVLPSAVPGVLSGVI